jgi:hypothetical protein
MQACGLYQLIKSKLIPRCDCDKLKKNPWPMKQLPSQLKFLILSYLDVSDRVFNIPFYCWWIPEVYIDYKKFKFPDRFLSAWTGFKYDLPLQKCFLPATQTPALVMVYYFLPYGYFNDYYYLSAYNIDVDYEFPYFSQFYHSPYKSSSHSYAPSLRPIESLSQYFDDYFKSHQQEALYTMDANEQKSKVESLQMFNALDYKLEIPYYILLQFSSSYRVISMMDFKLDKMMMDTNLAKARFGTQYEIKLTFWCQRNAQSEKNIWYITLMSNYSDTLELTEVSNLLNFRSAICVREKMIHGCGGMKKFTPLGGPTGSLVTAVFLAF